MAASQHYLPLASYLSDQFTVYVVDRRGRNNSGPQGAEYSLTKEFEDVTALLEKTKAKYMFGHSSGGVITLNVACQYPLTKIALYEPPLYFSTAWLPEFERLLMKNDTVGALLTAQKGLHLDGKLGLLPNPVLKLIFKVFLKEDKLNEIAHLWPTVPKEIPEVEKFAAKVDDYSKVSAEALFLYGGKSPAHLIKAIYKFESVLRHTRTVMFPRLELNWVQKSMIH
jgi:pimeloyl-ACP methyl ester carboxylesterase